MRTPTFGVYQCLSCGSLIEQELRRLPPFCCGIEMAKSCERTVPQDELLVPLSAAPEWVKTVGSRVANREPPPRTEFTVKQTL